MIFGVFLFVLKTSLVLGLALILTHKNWFSAAVRHFILLIALVSIPLMYFLEGVSVAWLRVEIPELVQLWILEANNWLINPIEIGVISMGASIIAYLKIHSPLILLIYGGGSLALLCYWVAQVFSTGKRVWDTHLLAGERIVFQASLGRQIKLRQSCLHESPYTWGVLKPVIVVPMDWLFWTVKKRNSVLVHEQAHIRRFDTLSNIVGGLLCCMCWYNPIIWVLRRRLSLLAELASDDQVLGQEVAAAEYASHLLEIVRSKNANLVPAMSSPSGLAIRIHAVLDEKRNRLRLNMSQLVCIVAISFAFIVPLGLVNVSVLPYSLMPAHPLQSVVSVSDNSGFPPGR